MDELSRGWNGFCRTQLRTFQLRAVPSRRPPGALSCVQAQLHFNDRIQCRRRTADDCPGQTIEFVDWTKFIIPGEKAGRLGVLRFKVLFTAMLVAFVIYAILRWVLWPVSILGDSMEPNYHAGERHFINKFAYRADPPQRGDVVGVQVSSENIYIKRIIGLPGEEISFTNGLVHINGARLEEKYVETQVPWPIEAVVLGFETYYVMGDNRAVSVLVKVRLDQILGQVVF